MPEQLDLGRASGARIHDHLPGSGPKAREVARLNRACPRRVVVYMMSPRVRQFRAVEITAPFDGDPNRAGYAGVAVRS